VSASAKHRALGVLARAGLLRPTFRAYERAQGWRFRSEPQRDGGVAIPPASLRFAVAGTARVEWFLESGRATVDAMVDLLARHGVDPAGVHPVLDFGCGCGRVLRHCRDVGMGDLYGTDHDRRLVSWCARNLPFARVEKNDLEPPTAYSADFFGLTLALSVFTHLSFELQRGWIDELARITRPGGHLLLTTHGESYLPRMTAAEQRRFREGRAVVRWQEAAGTNLCAVFHPPEYVATRLAPPFELLELVPEGARGMPTQDLSLLRLPEARASDGTWGQTARSARAGAAAPGVG
jgi:SAM-dependent methyltransferase